VSLLKSIAEGVRWLDMASSSRAFKAFAAVVLCAGVLTAQGIPVTPKALKLVQPEIGPLASAVLSIGGADETPRAWTATASTPGPDDAWIELGGNDGAGKCRQIFSAAQKGFAREAFGMAAHGLRLSMVARMAATAWSLLGLRALVRLCF